MDSKTMQIEEYVAKTVPTDKMPPEIGPVLMGLYGEVGGIMATAKKLRREHEVYTGYHDDAVEEFGDVLWYLTAICRRLNINLSEIFYEVATDSNNSTSVAASDDVQWPVSVLKQPADGAGLDATLLELGQCAARLLVLTENSEDAVSLLAEFVKRYVRSLRIASINFALVARRNIKKTVGRFVEPNFSELPTFDKTFMPEEQLPGEFEIVIRQRKSGKSYLQMNGIFLGDPLTDNIKDPDGYRFHDVFHLAHAAILHWSPVFRALLKHKRKSDPGIDEAQDGGRAIVVEEGLTAWIFSQAKARSYFVGQDRLSFDLLKGIQKFVAGYEVDQCPLKLWEKAILDGYLVFCEVKQNNGGVIIGNRAERSIIYRPLAR